MSLRALLKPVLPNLPQSAAGDELQILREVPVESLYLALKEADGEVVEWFFNAAAPRQVQGIVDLDCWTGAEFQPERFEPYFRQLTNLGPAKLADYMKKLDPEIVSRALLEYAEVLDFDPQEPPAYPERQILLTPDSKYALILRTDDPETREMLFQFLNRMSAGDIDHLRRMLETLKWEQKSDLEEFAYNVKKGRLEEMGFVDYHDAIGLYARGNARGLRTEMLENPLSPGTKTAVYARGESAPAGDDDEAAGLVEEARLQTDFLPVQMSAPLNEEGFFRESLAKVADPKLREVVLGEFVRALNVALSAERMLQGRLEDIAICTLRSRRYIDLGLAWLADKNAERGAELLDSQRIEQVLRLGWLLVQDMVQGRNELLKLLPAADHAQLDREILESLQGRHPRLDSRTLTDLGVPKEHVANLSAAAVPNLESLLLLGLRLQQLGVMARFLKEQMGESLKLDAEPRPVGQGAYARLVAGLFRQATGAAFSPAGLSEEEWQTLSPKLDANAVAKLVALVSGRCPDPARVLLAKRLAATFEDLSFQIRNNPSRRPDARYLSDIALA